MGGRNIKVSFIAFVYSIDVVAGHVFLSKNEYEWFSTWIVTDWILDF